MAHRVTLIPGDGFGPELAEAARRVLVLRHLGHRDAAEHVESALHAVVAEGRTVTHDLGGTAGTRAFTDAIVSRLGAVQVVPT